jgi:hypothetical protein
LEPAALTNPTVNFVLWEAFVTGKAKDKSALEPHIADARAAVLELARRLDTGHVESDIASEAVFSLIGAAALRARLSTDLDLLDTACLVIKAPILD